MEAALLLVVCVRTCVFGCMHVCSSLCKCVFVCVCVNGFYIRVDVSLSQCRSMFVSVPMRVLIHLCVGVCVYVNLSI